MISILVPSRGRPQECMQMQESLSNVAANVEVLVALDADDPTLELYEFEPFVTPLVSKRQILTKRWNHLALLSRGDYLMLGNDDMRFAGPEWVDMLCEIDPKKPSVIGFRAGAHTDNHFAFPILTRAGYEVQGFFVPEMFAGLYADTWLYDIGKKSGCIHYLPDYYIEHLHWSTRSRAADSTDMDCSTRKQTHDRILFNETEDQRKRISEKFQGY